MSGTKPTPGPWHQSWDFRLLGNGSDLRVVANACGPQHVCMKGARIADSDTVVPDKATMEKVYADASLIVRAVNCHADLVDGCNALLGLLQLLCARDDAPAWLKDAFETSHRVTEARAILSRAQAPTPEASPAVGEGEGR